MTGTAYCRPDGLVKSTLALEDGAEDDGPGGISRRGVHIDPHKIGVLGFAAGISGSILAQTSSAVCISLSIRPTKKAAGRISRWLFIPGICGLAATPTN